MNGINPDLQRNLYVLRIIVVAMIMGIVGLTAVAAVVGPLERPGQGKLPIGVLQIACMVLMATEAAAFVIIRSRLVAGVAGGTDAENDASLARAFISVTLIGCAMAEGVALLGAVIVLLDGLGASIVLIAVPLAALLVQFPTAGKWDAFVDRVRHSRT